MKKNFAETYQSLYGLPPLAGLCSMASACEADWSVEQSVTRWKRIHFVLKQMSEILVSKIASEPIYELKTAFSYHAYVFAEQVTLIRKRVSEMREPPLGLEHVPHIGLELALEELRHSPKCIDLLMGCYEVVVPAIMEACDAIVRDAHPLADAPSARIAKLIRFELEPVVDFGKKAIECLRQEDTATPNWTSYLARGFAAASGLDGTQAETPMPDAWFSQRPLPDQSDPQRDDRFQDPFNAGVNPEAFLYDEQFSARDKTLMMYYKRIREIDVPEMMSSILDELHDQEPWEFYYEMVRQLWDEARHAMMGEVGFVAQGIDWTQIPINFTWSRNLNRQLSARERHGVLFFIEQGLMPKTGKKFEWEVAMQSGDPLSGMFQDFDWADEVLHAQIGRRWYVPKFSSLSEALSYGDDCWSKVVSHWHEYREKGWTEHRNWWPDIYRQACSNWGVVPDPNALAFSKTYEDSRADLKKLS